MILKSESHFEKSLQHDLDDLCGKVREMARLDELALRQSMAALYHQDRQLAYIVILRDQVIDELEIELDQLCLRFLVRQQPVAGHLRFIYSVIKVIGELERVGDYGESIARQVVLLIPLKLKIDYDLFKKLADISITMFQKAMAAFLKKDVEQSRELMELEEEADKLRNDIFVYLYKLRHKNALPLKALGPLTTIARRLERVADQAQNFCEETLYIATGEMAKHKTADVFHILFVDKNNDALSQMAEGIGRAMQIPHFVFNSAGLTPSPLDAAVVNFMQGKGIDLSNHFSKSLDLLSQRQHFQVIVLLGLKSHLIPKSPTTKTLTLNWPIKLSKKSKKSDSTAVFEQAYAYLKEHIHDLQQAILGQNQDSTESTNSPSH